MGSIGCLGHEVHTDWSGETDCASATAAVVPSVRPEVPLRPLSRHGRPARIANRVDVTSYVEHLTMRRMLLVFVLATAAILPLVGCQDTAKKPATGTPDTTTSNTTNP